MKTKKSVVIIGGGPAGCQCALWLKMLGHNPLLIEKTHQLGGLQASSPYQNNWLVGLMNTTGRELAALMQSHLQSMNIDIWFNTALNNLQLLSDGFLCQSDQQQIETNYLVIASGVQPKRHHLIPSPTVLIGPGEQIHQFNFKHKRVALLGGGDNAAENYTFIMKQQPKVCHIYARTIRARQHLWSTVDKHSIFNAPFIVNQTDMSIESNHHVRHYDVIVVLYGWEANLPKAFLPIKNKLCGDDGFIMTDLHCQTNINRLYAIGEITNRMHPCVVTAMADGVVAAKAIQSQLES